MSTEREQILSSHEKWWDFSWGWILISMKVESIQAVLALFWELLHKNFPYLYLTVTSWCKWQYLSIFLRWENSLEKVTCPRSVASKFHNQYKKLCFCLIQKSAFPSLPSSLEGEAKFKKLLSFVFSQCVYLGMVEGEGWGWGARKWSHLKHFLHLTAFLPDSKLRVR